MSKKIFSTVANIATFGLAGTLLGGKKKAAPATTTAASTAIAGRPKPIITQLGAGGLGAPPPRPAIPPATLLSSKLGS